MHKFGYDVKHPGGWPWYRGTVTAPNEEAARLLVFWIHGGMMYPKGSGKTRTKVSIRRHPFHRQIRDGKAGNHIDWPV